MLKGLITEYEIITKSGIDLDFPVCELRVASLIEVNEFNGCLGKEFYKILKSCLSDYNCKIWCPKNENNETIQYELGEVVKYKGVLYVSIKSENEAIPSDREWWGFAPKFNTAKKCSAAYEELWCEYLCEYLALSIVKIRLPFIRTKVSKDGIISVHGSDFQAADKHSYQELCNAVDNMIAIVFGVMDDWMKSVNSNDGDYAGCFDNYKGIAISCCGDCGCDIKTCTCNSSCVEGKRSAGRINIA